MRVPALVPYHRITRLFLCGLAVFAILTLISFSTRRQMVLAGATTGSEPEATQVSFSNPATIAPADRASNAAGTNPGLPPLSVYPSTINVSGLVGSVSKVTVTFQVTSTFPDDLDILLIGPTGAKTLLISDGGGSGNITNASFTLDQTAATPFPDGGTDAMPVPPGTYRPANYVGFVTPEPGGQDNFPMAGGLQAFPAPDLGVFNGTNPNGTWSLYVVDDQQIDLNSLPNGWSIDITVSGPVAVPTSRVLDFDGDNKSDLAVVRNTGGLLTWFVRTSAGAQLSQQWGLVTDFPVPHDYDGDGKTDYAIFRDGNPANWYILRSSDNTLQSIVWGQAADDPSVVDDYNGDGRADAAVARREGGFIVWYILNSAAPIPTGTEGLPVPSITVRQWGLSTDFVAPGDYDGDGRADFAVQRQEGPGPTKATFYLLQSTAGASARLWGNDSDLVAPGDYDGDGKVDIAVVHQVGSSLRWYVALSNGGFILDEPWGLATDYITQGDYDGDNKTDLAVWRPSTGTFIVKRSSDGTQLNAPWGLSTDFPAANYNVH